MNKPSESNEVGAIQAVGLNLLSYLDFKSTRNETLGDIVRKASGSTAICDLLDVYLINNPKVKKLILVEQSRDIYNSNAYVRYDTKGFNAYTFKDPYSNTFTIVYRGTARGGWIQNGVAFGSSQNNIYYTYKKDNKGRVYIAGKYIVKEHLSTVQAYAVNYFNYNAIKYNWNELYNITVTGHSQGDCNAKLVTLKSPLVDICYGFNGPNFSKETITELQLNKEIYEVQKNKIYQYRTENDQVSIFGYEVVNENQIYYLKGNSLKLDHEIDRMVYVDYDKRGNPKISFNDYKEDRTFFASVLKKYNNILMELPVDIRGAVAIGTMWFAQNYFGRDKSFFNEKVQLWNICLAVVTSGIIIPIALIQAIEYKYGTTTKFIAAILMGFAVVIMIPIISIVLGGATVLGLVSYTIDKITSNGNQFMDIRNGLVKLLTELV
ncbi:hypothetical protein GC105_03560 [Alkalibaculum sp. M08DMB]|uniref:DUF2974 domain-containing protein n=1 Tax=Alkalibaculum sporogenes TaxID=2655001 RepID=A0A6A7K609_9FIRM|nr:hypothetical protein [Alkalibaculum sporogenes]MPW24866.1 hypothetical protein [Alkalibaculum sporogenes]